MAEEEKGGAKKRERKVECFARKLRWAREGEGRGGRGRKTKDLGIEGEDRAGEQEGEGGGLWRVGRAQRGGKEEVLRNTTPALLACLIVLGPIILLPSGSEPGHRRSSS